MQVAHASFAGRGLNTMFLQIQNRVLLSDNSEKTA